MLAYATACSSVDWIESPSDFPASWRHLRLYETTEALVLASSERAARDVISQAREAGEIFAEFSSAPIGRLLLIAVDAEDPPLLAEASDYETRVARWHARATERPPPESSHGESVDPDEPEFDRLLLMRLISFGLPRDDLELGVPAALRARAAGILVLPTEACIEHAVEALMVVAREEMARDDEVGMGERAMIALAMPFMKSMMRKEFMRLTQGRFFELLATLAESDLVLRSQLLIDCSVRIGLEPEDAEPWISE